MASGFADAFPPIVRFLLAASVVSWIPGGVFLTRFINAKPQNSAQRFSLYFMYGLGLVSILTWLAALIGVTFGSFTVLTQWLLGLFFAAGMVIDWRRAKTGAGDIKNSAEKRGVGWAPGLYVAAAVVIGVLTMIYPPRLDYLQDAYDHIGYVRHVVAEDSLTPGGVLAAPAGVDITERPADPRKGTFHVVTALAARLSGVDPGDALRLLAVFLFPLAFINFVLFCEPFLPRRWLMAPCAGLFLLFQGGIGFEYPDAAAYGQNLSLLFFWTLVPLCFAYFESPRRKALAGILVVFTGGAFVHAGVILHFLILLATVFIFQKPLGLPGRAVLKLCSWGSLAAALTIAWKFISSSGDGNIIHLHPQGLLYLGGEQFVLSPVEILGHQGLVFWGGLIAAPLFVFAARRSAHARRILAFAVIPLVICFTPFLTPLLFRGATYMVSRSLMNVPVYALVAAAFWGLVVWARSGPVIKKVFGAAVLILWSWIFLAPSFNAFISAVREARAGESDSFSAAGYGEVLDFIKRLPSGAVVLSDPVTSYWLSSAADLRVVAVLGQHGAPNDEYAMDRLECCRDVLSPYTLRSQAVRACDRYGVGYVVLNGRLGSNRYDYLVDWNRSMFDQTREKLDPMAARFRIVFDSNDVVIYRYYSEGIVEDLWSPEFPVVNFDPGAAAEEGVMSPCRVNAPGGIFEISSVGLSPRRVRPGETVHMTLAYYKQDVSAYSLPVIVHVRFDHESVNSNSGKFPGEKYIRRYHDRREGSTGRYRYDHRPFGGLYTPDLWPIARKFYEFVPVKLPSTLKAGTYRVEFKIDTDALLPNFSIRDFLYDRDHYSGKSCFELEVTD